MGSLGSEGSLTPYLLTERTRKQYCLPLTRSNSGNRGEFTTTSRLASSQLLFPARDWSKHSIRKPQRSFQKYFFKDVFMFRYHLNTVNHKMIRTLPDLPLLYVTIVSLWNPLWGGNYNNRTGHLFYKWKWFFTNPNPRTWIISGTFDRFGSFNTVLNFAFGNRRVFVVVP